MWFSGDTHSGANTGQAGIRKEKMMEWSGWCYLAAAAVAILSGWLGGRSWDKRYSD